MHYLQCCFPDELVLLIRINYLHAKTYLFYFSHTHISLIVANWVLWVYIQAILSIHSASYGIKCKATVHVQPFEHFIIMLLYFHQIVNLYA